MLDLEKKVDEEIADTNKETDVEVIKTDSDEKVNIDIVKTDSDENESKEEVVAIIEPETVDSSMIIEVQPTQTNESDSQDKSKKKKHGKSATEVVEVTNIPNTEVATKKKGSKFVSFVAFTTIVLALVFSIVDWVVAKFTSNPQIVLHLMDWITIILYLIIASKAYPFLSGKKKWVKVLYWICVVATLVCIIVPMALDYAELAELIKEQNANQNASKALNIIRMFALA